MGQKILVLIQARTNSSRFPNKVMQTVGGKTMVKRVWEAAYEAKRTCWVSDIQMVWPELYADLFDENNLLAKFRKAALEHRADIVIRLTADCPLISVWDIRAALIEFKFNLRFGYEYYNNRKDGYDVQISTINYLLQDHGTDKVNVFKDTPNRGGVSVDTPEDLEKVRRLWKTRSI